MATNVATANVTNVTNVVNGATANVTNVTNGADATFLNDIWTLYYHDPDDSNWTLESYHKLAPISTVEELATVAVTLSDTWDKGMFFIMREHVQPLWEDKHNKLGGCFSMKVMKNHVNRVWFQTCAQTLGETLVKDNTHWSTVTGISISPKKNFCIVRIWIGDAAHKDVGLYRLHNPEYTEIFFKPH